MEEITVSDFIGLIQDKLRVVITDVKGDIAGGGGQIEITSQVYFDGSPIMTFTQKVDIEPRIAQRGIKSSDFGKGSK